MQDTIKVSRADDPNCGVTQTAHFFDAGQKLGLGLLRGGGRAVVSARRRIAGGGNVPGPILVVNQTPPAPPLSTTG